MGDTIKKYGEDFDFFFDEQKPVRKLSNILTPKQAQEILNKVLTEVDSEDLKEDINNLKEYLYFRL